MDSVFREKPAAAAAATPGDQDKAATVEVDDMQAVRNLLNNMSILSADSTLAESVVSGGLGDRHKKTQSIGKIINCLSSLSFDSTVVDGGHHAHHAHHGHQETQLLSHVGAASGGESPSNMANAASLLKSSASSDSSTVALDGSGGIGGKSGKQQLVVSHAGAKESLAVAQSPSVKALMKKSVLRSASSSAAQAPRRNSPQEIRWNDEGVAPPPPPPPATTKKDPPSASPPREICVDMSSSTASTTVSSPGRAKATTSAIEEDLRAQLDAAHRETERLKRQYQADQELILAMSKRCSGAFKEGERKSTDTSSDATTKEGNRGGGGQEGASSSQAGGKELAFLRDKLLDLQQQNSDLFSKYANLQCDYAEQSKTIATLRSANVRVNEEKASMEVEYLNELASLAESKEAMRRQFKKRIRGKNDSIKFLGKHILSQDAKVKELEEQFLQMNMEIRHSFDEADERTEDDDKDDGENKDEDDSKNNSESEIEHENENDSTDKQKDKAINAKKDKSDAGTSTDHKTKEQKASMRVALLKEENEALMSEMRKLSAEKARLEEEMVELKGKVMELTNVEVTEMPSLKSQLKESTAALSRLEEEIDFVKKDKQKTEEELRSSLAESLYSRCTMETDYVEQLDETEHSHQALVDDLKTQVEQKKAENSELERKMATMREKMIRLEGKLELRELEPVPEGIEE